MKVHYFTKSYFDRYIIANDRASYEESAPELFNNYYSFWADRTIDPVKLSREELNQRLEHIKGCLSQIEKAFDSHGLNIADLELSIIVGQNISNGHAWQSDGRFQPWVAAETYTSKALALIFVTHEIIHALHYRATPGFYFSNPDEKENSLRQLITEGLASWLTSELLAVSHSEALWADYLKPDQAEQWLGRCESHRSEIAVRLLESVRTGKPTQLFVLADPDDIMANRAGYYLGLKVMQEIAKQKQLTPIKLLNLERSELEQLTLACLNAYPQA